MSNNIMTIKQNGPATIIKFSGELDAASIPELRHRIDKEIDEKISCFVLDIKEVPFIDSHGVGLFVSILKKAHSRNGKLSFCGAQEQPVSILKMVGFNNGLVEYFDNLETYIAVMSRQKSA